MGFPPILPSKGKLADSKPKLITASEEFHLALKQIFLLHSSTYQKPCQILITIPPSALPFHSLHQRNSRLHPPPPDTPFPSTKAPSLTLPPPPDASPPARHSSPRHKRKTQKPFPRFLSFCFYGLLLCPTFMPYLYNDVPPPASYPSPS